MLRDFVLHEQREEPLLNMVNGFPDAVRPTTQHAVQRLATAFLKKQKAQYWRTPVFNKHENTRLLLFLSKNTGIAVSVCTLLFITPFVSLAQMQEWQSEGILVTSETAPNYRRLPEIENQLYGHAYPNQAVSQRIARIERTLFNGTQSGPAEMRLRRIEETIQQANSKTQLASQEPILAYLENKMFQQTYENRPLTERVRQLEVQVFGRSFENYPTAIRLKKLTYAMPIVAKEIRLTKNDGAVIASTRHPAPSQSSRKSTNATSATTFKAEPVELDATRVVTKTLAAKPIVVNTLATKPDVAKPVSFVSSAPPPVPKPISKPVLQAPTETRFVATAPVIATTGLISANYIHAIHRNQDGTSLRWKTLPLHVFVLPSNQTPEENTVIQQAIQAWQRAFAVEPVADSSHADILISWSQSDWAQNTTSLLTRPVLHMDSTKKLRTVILITMYPLHDAPLTHQLHAMTHQLGHAFGLWGHSNNPEDIMYPLLKTELNDFPHRWAWRSTAPAEHGEFVGIMDDVQPSQRDMNTLLKIYDIPATDLSAYKPIALP